MYRNQKGISLMEIVVALPLGVIVFTIMTLAVSNFVSTYQEMRLYTQLQDELYSTIDMIRHGYVKEGIEATDGLIGLMTANKVQISGNRDALTLRPVVITQGLPDAYKTTFRVDTEGRLKVSGQYGLQTFQETQVFPSSNRIVGRELQFKITNSDVFFATQSSSNGTIMVNINLEGRVRFREKSRGQDPESDIKLNTRSVKFNTSVFVANTKG